MRKTTARDVIARALDATDLGQEGNRVADYHPDDQALMRDYTRWDDFTDRAEKLRQQRHQRAADAVVAALAAAGMSITETPRAGICGDRAPVLADQHIVCTLHAGHIGWHEGSDRSQWTGKVAPETPDEWEWGLRHPDNHVGSYPQATETSAREAKELMGRRGYSLVRRRPAGPWEVAP